jgi:hypothetical protein
VRPLEQQIDDLVALFPELQNGTSEVISRIGSGELMLPNGAEDWFAIPRWQKLGDSYNTAFVRLLAALSDTSGVENRRMEALGPDCLRQHERTVRMMDEVAATQMGDILVIPAQFGMRHRGRSVRRVRAVLRNHEFGLGAFAVCSMLLTHPERLVTTQDLCIECPGDEYRFGATVVFKESPVFSVHNRRLEFNTAFVEYFYWGFGSASGFLVR